MKRIIKDTNKLRVPAEPLKFITDTGIIKEEGEEIISESGTIYLKVYIDESNFRGEILFNKNFAFTLFQLQPF